MTENFATSQGSHPIFYYFLLLLIKNNNLNKKIDQLLLS